MSDPASDPVLWRALEWIDRGTADLRGEIADLKQQLGFTSVPPRFRGFVAPDRVVSVYDIGGPREITGIELRRRE